MYGFDGEGSFIRVIVAGCIFHWFVACVVGSQFRAHGRMRELTLYEAERELAAKEVERMSHVLQALKTQGYEIRGFYHTSTWKDYWAEVITEQLYLLDGYRKFPPKSLKKNESDYIHYRWDFERDYVSLLNISTGLYLNVATDADNELAFTQIQMLIDSLNLRNRAKIEMHFNHTVSRYAYLHGNRHQRGSLLRDEKLSTGEYTTISALKNYCDDITARGKKAMVYYMHSKGSCCWKNSWNTTAKSPVSTWREYMNAVNIEFPSICTRAILKQYGACGAENQDAHFSGNFWWADCQHIARLEALKDRYDFMESELFVLRGHPNSTIARYFGFQCGYSVYNCGVNLYLDECPRSKYFDRIVRNVYHHKIIPSNVNPDTDNTHVCHHLRAEGKTYFSQADEIQGMYRIHERNP